MAVDDVDAYLAFFERKIVSREKVPTRELAPSCVRHRLYS